MYVWSRLGFKCISFWWSEVFLHNRKVFPLMETEVSGNSLPNLFLCNKGYLQPFHTLLHYDPRLCEKSTQPAGAPSGACDGLRWVWTLWHRKTEGLDFFDSIWMDLCTLSTPLLHSTISRQKSSLTVWKDEQYHQIGKWGKKLRSCNMIKASLAQF